MADVLTLSLALRPVRIEISEDELAAKLREQSRGFVLGNDVEPWLTIRVERLGETSERGEAIVVTPLAEGRYTFQGSRLRGHFSSDVGRRVEAEVMSVQSLHQLLHFCLSMLLPAEGAVIIHADTVEWKGEAVCFFGHSGRGKSTAARQMIDGGARLIAADRTVIGMHDQGVSVLTLPKMNRREELPDDPMALKVSGLVYPRRGRGVVVRSMSRFDAMHRLLQAVNFPRGEGLPVGEALTTVERILSMAWAAELSYEPGRSFHDALPLERTDP